MAAQLLLLVVLPTSRRLVEVDAIVSCISMFTVGVVQRAPVEPLTPVGGSSPCYACTYARPAFVDIHRRRSAGFTTNAYSVRLAFPIIGSVMVANLERFVHALLELM